MLKKMILTGVLAGLFSLQAHDTGHSTPDKLPPIGPHGGNYTKLTRHYAEIVVNDNKVTVYILERDVKHVAEDAENVTVIMKVQRQGRKNLNLTQNKETLGYSAPVDIPRRARRVMFTISCELDGKKEKGTLLYETR